MHSEQEDGRQGQEEDPATDEPKSLERTPAPAVDHGYGHETRRDRNQLDGQRERVTLACANSPADRDQDWQVERQSLTAGPVQKP